MFNGQLLLLNSEMKEEIYSIKDLENFTHIKAHTIRIWEQRYKLLTPKRTESNIRYYDKEDLKKILNVNLLYTNGMKISKIAALSDSEITKQCKEILNQAENLASKEVENYILKLTDFDHVGVRNLLDKSLKNHSIEEVFSEVLRPLLIRMGELWQVSTLDIVHEHFLSGLLREFLISKTIEFRKKKTNGKKAVFFLHGDELHEFSLLFYQLIFTREGYDCYYLGQNLPLEELKFFNSKIKPDIFVTSFVSQLSEKEFKKHLEVLGSFTKNKKLVISGSQAVKYKEFVASGIDIIENETDLQRLFV